MIEAVLHAPVVIKVLGSLALIVLFNALSKNLMLAMVIGTLTLGLWCGHALLPTAAQPGLLGIAFARLASLDLLLLLFIVFQVIWLSMQMAKAGVMQDLVATVRGRISQRASMAVLPAVIGWLPMPGGALFSAPLVDSCDTDGTINPEIKTATNYWFRHIWEYWWPIYPGVLLAIDETGLEIWQFVLLQMPLSLCAIVGGHLFLLRRIPDADPATQATPVPSPHRFTTLISPILLVIAVVILVETASAGLRATLPGFVRPQKYLPMMLGILAAMLLLNRQRPLSQAAWKEILFSSRTLRLVLLVALVRVFGALIDARLPGGPLLVEAMRQEFATWHIPLLLIIILVPFISGMSTGLAIGFVGASFPIVMSLIPAGAPTAMVFATTALAYAAGHSGMMLSPVHVCLIVTNEHFRTRLLRSLGRLVGPGVIVTLGGLAMYALLMRFWPA